MPNCLWIETLELHTGDKEAIMNFGDPRISSTLGFRVGHTRHQQCGFPSATGQKRSGVSKAEESVLLT